MPSAIFWLCNMNLPLEFRQEIEELFTRFGLDQQLDAFWAAMEKRPIFGLRINSQKIKPERMCRWLQEIYPQYKLPKVPWSDVGLIIPEELQPGTLPLYRAGLYYIQEPSAMLPAEVLAARPGEYILDLCAAPGGKASRIAADMGNYGLLWANDVSAERVRALLRNLELGGGSNILISNEKPANLAPVLTGYFDAVMLDAPCSGSGMFRRDPAAIQSWQKYGSATSVPVQRELLENAWSMLAPGGRLVYSTCTFSLAENEGNIAWFCDKYPDAKILPIEKSTGVSDGLPLTSEMQCTARIWPHLASGEGHFCALLRKTKTKTGPKPGWSSQSRLEETPSAPELKAFADFCDCTLSPEGRQYMDHLLQNGSLRLERDHLHLLTFTLPNNLRRKVKTGLFLGSIRRDRLGKCRFEPAQALIMHLRAEHIKINMAATYSDQITERYLRGETLQHELSNEQWTENALGAFCLEYEQQKWPLGWIRTMREPSVKNLYPASWRQIR